MNIECPTPQWLFNRLDAEFRFTLDPCSTHENTKCVKHFTLVENGLSQSWEGERVFMNPPYGAKNLDQWMMKARMSRAQVVVCLVPSATGTKWWHEHVEPGRVSGEVIVRFLKGRVKFVGDGSPRFDSAIIIYTREYIQ